MGQYYSHCWPTFFFFLACSLDSFGRVNRDNGEEEDTMAKSCLDGEILLTPLAYLLLLPSLLFAQFWRMGTETGGGHNALMAKDLTRLLLTDHLHVFFLAGFWIVMERL